MTMIIILVIWLVAPLAGLGIIIGLAVMNNRNKKKIQTLLTQLEAQKKADLDRMVIKNGNRENRETSWVIPETGNQYIDFTETVKAEAPEAVSTAPEVRTEREDAARTSKPTRQSRSRSVDFGFSQGTAALIIGVIFVVLAGLIFATTTWHVLPSIWKVVLVFGFSGLFFGASLLAGKVFKIKRTSQAFYILSSVFLFLTVLAAGYFGLLGPEFILKGENRWRVLLVGSIVTELALFAGLRSFTDRIYGQACLWGMTVSMTFLMGALRLKYAGGLNCMVSYSFLLLVWDDLRKRGQAGKRIWPEVLSEGFGFFANIHFWVFSILMILQVSIGLLCAFTGILQDEFGVTLWSTLALALMAGGIRLQALRRKTLCMKVLYSAAIALLLQYAGFGIPADYEYRVLAGALATGLWFIISERKESPLDNMPGKCILTTALVLDTVLLLSVAFTFALLSWDQPGEQMAASAAVVMLAAVTAQWSRRYPVMRSMVLVVLFPLTITGLIMIGQLTELDMGYDRVAFIYLLAAVMWDILKKDKFYMAILVIGTGMQLIFMTFEREPHPFFILLAVYLFVLSFRQEGIKKELCIKGSCLYSLAGVWIIAGSMTENGVMRMTWVAAAFAVEYAAAYRISRESTEQRFWDITGAAVSVLTMLAFYMGDELELWNIVPCIIIFAVFYTSLYRRGRLWPHLAVAASALLLPQAAFIRYGLTENQIYGCTAAAVLISGCLFRRYKPVIEVMKVHDEENRGNVMKETDGSWNADWFHILVILIILPVTWAAGSEWSCVYTFLTALYVLQYMALAQWRREALTLSAAITVLAFWIQPFVKWPELMALEVQLVPAALFIWILSFIWKNKRWLPLLQTVLLCLCLLSMVIDAFHTGNVVDALILEAVCLIIFIWAHIRKCTRWIRISGIIIITVALYMTKNFWLSLSWWVYLLAAGLGLILFAAGSEMKKR